METWASAYVLYNILPTVHLGRPWSFMFFQETLQGVVGRWRGVCAETLEIWVPVLALQQLLVTLGIWISGLSSVK